jgi:hypothetical protein
MTEDSAASTKPRRKLRSIRCAAKYSKRKGMMAELIFVVKATSMGFAVSKPYGDCEPYDLVVEEGGRLLRIQVKSAFSTARWGYSVAVARHLYRGPMVQYCAEEIDFIAAYVVPYDVWYIVPISEIGSSTQIHLYPEGAKRSGGAQFEQYREAWDLLRRGAARPTEPGRELKGKLKEAK